MDAGPALQRIQQDRFARWGAWSQRLVQQVYDLHHHRQIWRELNKALGDAEDSVFLEHYTRLYVTHQCMNLRRLVDTSPDSVSLGRLLQELADHPETITRDRYLAMYGPEDWKQRIAQDAFDRYADGSGDNVDPTRVRRDLAQWKSACGPIRIFVNKSIAHLDEDFIPKATFDQLDHAIDTVASTMRRYNLLIDATSILDFEPTIQTDWKRPLRDGLRI